MKKIIALIALLSAAVTVFAGEAKQPTSNAGQDIGKGMVVGGAASSAPGSGIVALAGVIVDIVSGLLGSTDINKESPEYKAKLERMYTQQARLDSYAQYKERLSATPETTDKEIKNKAEEFCAFLDKTAKDGTYFQMSRSRLKKMIRIDGLLPPGDDEVILYKLPTNPIPNCVDTLDGNGHRLLQMAKKNAGK